MNISTAINTTITTILLGSNFPSNGKTKIIENIAMVAPTTSGIDRDWSAKKSATWIRLIA